MSVLLFVYILNATLLLLHEIESGYEKEWELLKLPGGITGFLLMHIPIILLLFWGLIELYRQTTTGVVIGVVAGLGGLIPFVIHKLMVKKAGHFDKPISNVIIILNVVTGLVTMVLAIGYLIG